MVAAARHAAVLPARDLRAAGSRRRTRSIRRSSTDGFAHPAGCGPPTARAAFLLGTDDQGRDVFSAILYGLRVSLTVGVLGVLFCGALGIALGLIAGYVGGARRRLIMRIADVQLTFPAILIALLSTASRAVLGNKRDEHDACWPCWSSRSACLLGAIRAHRARLDHGREEQGLRAGRAADRPARARDHVPPRPAQRDRAGAGDRDHQPRARDHHRGDAVVPRRRPAADPALARHADPHRQQFPVLRRMVDRRLPRHRRSPLLVLAINLLGDWLRDALNPKLR